MVALAGLAALAGVAIGVVVIRRPVLARIAVRGASRRKGETVLVVLGSLLGTAIITGSLLVGDTLDASFRASAPNQLGPTDLVVSAADPATADRALDAAVALDSASEDVDGILALRTAAAAIATPVPAGGRGDRRAQPSAQLLEVDFADAAAFGGDPAATGISGAGPGDGETVVGRDLADELGIEGGDTVEVFAYGARRELRVSGVLPRTGIAGFSTGPDTTSMNAFVAPGTIDDLRAGAPPSAAGAQPPAELVLVSAAGGVMEGADLTDAVTGQLEQALAEVEGADIRPLKSETLDNAEAQGEAFSQLFLAIGSFAVLAGILLLVSIFVMLAEERKSELGMLRAVGLRRGDLVRVFVVEGALYSLVSAALGALLGIGVGRVIVLVTSGIFSSFGDLALTFTAPPASIVTGFLVGLLIAMATILLTSLRIARVNIIRAIRDLPEPTGRRRRPVLLGLQALAAVGFAGLAAVAIARKEPLAGLAFPALAALCAAPPVSAFLPRRATISVLALGVLVYAVFADQIVGFAGGDINVFVVQGVVLTASAVAVVSQNQETIGAVLRRLSGGRSLVARLGLAYPLARRFRTSMTLAMYSLVIFTLVFISVLSQVFASLTDSSTVNEGGGYDLLVDASPTNPVDPDDLSAVEGVDSVSTLLVGGALYRTPSRDDFIPWGIAGVDAEFVDGGPPALREWDRGAHPDETAVWRAVLADPSLAVVDAFFGQSGGGPPEDVVAVGDVLAVRDPATGRVSQRTVAALADAGLTFSIWMSVESARDAVTALAPTRSYVVVDDGADPEAVAARLRGELVEAGVQADTFRGLVADNTAATNQFFRLMQGYLALGLVVGIAGLGVIMVRAVRERRRQIGMLRSLGFPAAKVRAAFLFESGFVALEGIVIGTALALVTSYQIVVNSDALGDLQAAFVIPADQLALVLGTALVASLAATAAPARQAARIRPAVALRIAD